ncbi:MAG TPA: hypothetical protein VMU47_22590, partial [Caldimonas sp.]|nr:hypothetical protein [Caldimonas sp.]
MYSAISSEAFSKRSGRIDGRPTALYISSKNGDSSSNAASAICLICRIGCAFGTRFSASITISIARCRRSSPRIRLFLPNHCSVYTADEFRLLSTAFSERAIKAQGDQRPRQQVDLGVLHRYLVSPAPRSALVLGKALSSTVRGFSQALVVYALTVILGVR